MIKPTRATLPLLLGATLLTAAVAAPAASAAPFGPTLKKCSKLKSKSAKKKCAKRNAQTRTSYNAIKNGRYVGTLFNGVAIDATFCANGKWKITVAVPRQDLQEFSGSRWKFSDGFVSRTYLTGLATGPSRNIYTRVGLQRRSGKWVLSDGNPTLKAPPATRTSATAACASL